MKANDIRKKYIEFFKARGHAEIPSAPLVPENDPTTLFNSSGMQPLVPYLLGQPHPAGKRLVNSQKAVRLQDIDEVGDNSHTTFFEMLGNWSLGDYFKKEQLPWVFEFLTRELDLPEEKLFVSVFEGTKDVPRDEESATIWKSLGIAGERIFYYGVEKNWWSRVGEPEKMPPGEPGGPDSEVFFDFGTEFGFHERSIDRARPCHPNCQCGRFMEIANSVFMQYVKKENGSLAELPNKNVDFGGGLERLTAATEDNPDVFQTDLFTLLYQNIEVLTGKKYGEIDEETRAIRIICDHIKAAVMMSNDGVIPSNKTQGYILRRLIRRALLYGRKLGLSRDFSYVGKLVRPVAEIYGEAYPEVTQKAREIALHLEEEALRFGKSLERGLAEIEKTPKLDGKVAFYLYESYGFPWEMTGEIARQRKQQIDYLQFEQEFKKHQELSRAATKGMFRGGLADQSETTTKLHTAHHLLLAALQKIVDPSIRQRGSNITSERIRMDFNFGRKITAEELKDVETLVNKKVSENLPVTHVEMKRQEAEKIGAQMEFGHKYPDSVSIYFIGPQKSFFSAEFCGGPHVSFTGTLGHFTIVKEVTLGSGVRRIYATLNE